MNILLVGNVTLPAHKYGAIERIMWWLGKEYVKMGHHVSFLVHQGSVCPFGTVIFRQPELKIEDQIPDEIDVVHFQYPITGFNKKPHIATIHGNSPRDTKFSINSVFVSADHASRYGAEAYVYNGIDADDYGAPNLEARREYFHFLGKAAWRIKNVRGAINIATAAREKLLVLGGTRLNFKMGFRFTPNLNVSFKGMVGGEEKNALLSGSKGLIFPVRWHEPFGIAMIESLYFGCPVFGTPYGALPELITKEVGVLSNRKSVLVEAVKNVDAFNRKACYEYVCDNFLASKMAADYIEMYARVINGESLNKNVPSLVADGPKFLEFIND